MMKLARHILVLVTASAVVGASAASASAQSTAPTSTMRACWVEGSGVVYRRDTTGAPTGCQQDTHRAIEWTLGVIPTSGGGGIAVPLLLTGSLPSSPTVTIENTSTAGGSPTTGGAGLYVNNVSAAATMVVENKATDAGGFAIAAVGRGAAPVANFFNSGTGQAVRAFSTSEQATINVSNQATTGAPAFAAQSRGIFHTGNFENLGAGGSVWASSTSPDRPTGFFINKAETGGVALSAESKGAFTTVDFRNTGTAGGGAIRASSTSSGCSVCLYNENTANGHALYAEAKGAGPVVIINNDGSAGGNALNAVAMVPNGSTINAVNNSTTGFGAALYAESKTGGFSVNIENTGIGPGLRANSNAANATVNFNNTNTGNGFAMWASSVGTNSTLGAANNGSGGTMYLENQSSSNATMVIEAKGGAPSIYTKSGSQNGVIFENTGTGQNISILGISNGVWPTAQFENRSGGIALRANGSAIIAGNLRIEGNYEATGTKNAVVPTSTGTRKMYTEEATEVWFADYGHATLRDSVVWVPFDATFAETIEQEHPYHVFLQAYGDASIYVSRRTTEGFEVRMRGDRAHEGPIDFSYRLVAKRRGYGNDRLERGDLPVHNVSPTPGGK